MSAARTGSGRLRHEEPRTQGLSRRWFDVLLGQARDMSVVACALPTPCSTGSGRDRRGGYRYRLPVPKGWQSDSVPTCVAQGPDHAFSVATAGRLLRARARAGLAIRARARREGLGHRPDHRAGLRVRQQRRVLCHRVPGARANAVQPGRRRGAHLARRPHAPRRWQAVLPPGFAAGRNGSIYVSNCSIAPATGLGPHLCPKGGRNSPPRISTAACGPRAARR